MSDLTSRHIGQVIWAPPGGRLEVGEAPFGAVLRELIEAVGFRTTGPALQPARRAGRNVRKFLFRLRVTARLFTN